MLSLLRSQPRPARSRRRYAAPLSAVLAGVLSVSLATPALADLSSDKRNVDNKIEHLHDVLEDTSAELAQAYQQLQASQAQLPTAQAALESAQSAARAADAHNTEVAGQLAVAQANEARAVEAQARSAAQIEATQRTLDAFAADLFQGDGGGSQLSVALGATSPDDFATRIVLADTVSSMTTSTLDQLAAAQAEAEASQAYLTAVREEVAELKRQAEIALAAARSRRAEAQAAKDALDALVANQASLAATVESRKAAEQAQLQELENESAALQAMIVEQARKAREEEARRKAAEEAARKAAEAKGQTYIPGKRDEAKPGAGRFLNWPTSGRTTSEFGMRVHPILGYLKLHTGLDFGAACGTPVFAAASGTVIATTSTAGYGNRIVIDHGMQRGVDLVTTYNHLSRVSVRDGASVSRGQVIGAVGNTGRSTGCHLHFETLEDGSFVNPRRWL